MDELSHNLVDFSQQTVAPNYDIQQLLKQLDQTQKTLQMREAKLIEATQIIEELQDSESGRKFELLKEQVMTELQLKSDEIEIEAEEIERQRHELMARQERLEEAFQERVAALEHQYHDISKSDLGKIRQEVKDLRKNNDSKQHEIDQLKVLIETKELEQKSIVTPRTDQSLKVEIKRLKEEMDRLRKSHSDREIALR